MQLHMILKFGLFVVLINHISIHMYLRPIKNFPYISYKEAIEVRDVLY